MVIGYRCVFGTGFAANGTRETSRCWETRIRRVNHLSRLSSFSNDYKPGTARVWVWLWIIYSGPPCCSSHIYLSFLI